MVQSVKMRLMVLLLLICMPVFITVLSAAPCELLFLLTRPESLLYLC